MISKTHDNFWRCVHVLPETIQKLVQGKLMGPVPTGVTLEKLIGKRLDQVCIGPFDLPFRCDCTRGLACTGTVIVELDNPSCKVFQGAEPYWLAVTTLPLIAGRDVTAWKIASSHEFSVSLTSGVRLRFLSTDFPYEEFVFGPGLWVVCLSLATLNDTPPPPLHSSPPHSPPSGAAATASW